MKRFRRRSGRRRRVEPVTWVRTCAKWLINRSGEDGPATCDEALCNSGLVLFDPSPFVMSISETRTTVKRIHWPTSVQVKTINMGFIPAVITLVVVKTNRELGTFVGAVQLDEVLNGTFDVLDVKVLGFTAFNANGDTFEQIQQRDWDPTAAGWDIRVQRKLDVGEQIVCLAFVQQAFENDSLGSNSGIFVAFNSVVSVLFQRTLT